MVIIKNLYVDLKKLFLKIVGIDLILLCALKIGRYKLISGEWHFGGFWNSVGTTRWKHEGFLGLFFRFWAQSQLAMALNKTLCLKVKIYSWFLTNQYLNKINIHKRRQNIWTRLCVSLVLSLTLLCPSNFI